MVRPDLVLKTKTGHGGPFCIVGDICTVLLLDYFLVDIRGNYHLQNSCSSFAGLTWESSLECNAGHRGADSITLCHSL